MSFTEIISWVLFAVAYLLSLQSLLQLVSGWVPHPRPYHISTRMHSAHTAHSREATLRVNLTHHGVKPWSRLPRHGTRSRTRVGTTAISTLHSHGRGARVALPIHALGVHTHRGVRSRTRTREGFCRRGLVWTMTLKREKTTTVVFSECDWAAALTYLTPQQWESWFIDWMHLFHEADWLGTWLMRSGMPRARSISSRAMTSVLLSRESSWSSRARSSLWPSVVDGGTRRSSRELLNGSLMYKKQTKRMLLTCV